MKPSIVNIVLFTFCVAHAAADTYTTLVHHKDGRTFAIASDQIDSITHTSDISGAALYNLTDSFAYPPYAYAMMGIMLQAAAGTPNTALCSEQNIASLFSQQARFEQTGTPWMQPPMFSIIDDDAIDEFIPSSYPPQSIKDSDKKVGGYFSLMYPFIKSLEVRYGVPLSCGISAEGQRIGLTKYRSASDACAINENGQLLQQLTARAHWECLCHSMTARISPSESMYIVDSLNATDAADILANGKWDGAYSFTTTGVYDRQTGKNYTINRDRTGWTETLQKYIQPYCLDPKTRKWIYNETYPINYQLGEWKRRATLLGFTYPDILVYCGNTTAAPLINDSRRFFSHSVDPSGLGEGVNNVPLGASIHRISTIASGVKNVYNPARYQRLKQAVDEAIASNGWLVFMSHFNTLNYYNGYLDGVDYPDRDADYNPEWINPLVTDELRSMDENNYWDYPPERLGIKDWGEWQPAKGTQLWGLYKIFEYALDQQMLCVSPSEGVKIIGNKVNIGVYRDQGLYPLEKAMQLKPEDKCYYVVGADGSIKYESQK